MTSESTDIVTLPMIVAVLGFYFLGCYLLRRDRSRAESAKVEAELAREEAEERRLAHDWP
jgi:hypothetical protein